MKHEISVTVNNDLRSPDTGEIIIKGGTVFTAEFNYDARLDKALLKNIAGMLMNNFTVTPVVAREEKK